MQFGPFPTVDRLNGPNYIQGGLGECAPARPGAVPAFSVRA